MRTYCSIALTLLVLLASQAVFAAGPANLGPDESFRLVQQRGDLFLLDVRTPMEYQQFRLANATLIPIDQLMNRMSELPHDRPILVYCAVGSRSAQVVNYLVRRGFSQVYNLYGGIYAWANRGYPILKGRG